MYQAKKIDYECETKKIIIEVPKNLKMLTAVTVCEVEDKSGLIINTKTYGTDEIKKLEEAK